MQYRDFADFETQMKAKGFDQILERVWGPDEKVEVHTHPFDVYAIVTQGGFKLSCEGNTRDLRPGDIFELTRNTPHSEHYGANGAVFWAARRS